MNEDCKDKNGKSVSLKEFFDLKIDNLAELNNERFKQAADALILQAAETERRLNLLNGEAERLRLIQATYLPRELYENHATEIERKIDELRDFKNISQGKNSIIAAVVSIGVSAIFLIVEILIRK